MAGESKSVDTIKHSFLAFEKFNCLIFRGIMLCKDRNDSTTQKSVYRKKITIRI